MSFRYRVFSEICFASMLLVGCSSGDEKVAPGGAETISPPEALWEKGVFKPRGEFADFCANPRIGEAFTDRQGTAMHEKLWLRSMSHELYLWNDELDDIDPEPFSVDEYFSVLKVPYPKDRFHFSQASQVYDQGSTAGVYFGYGIVWAIVKEPHDLGVQSVEQGVGLPSTLKRGDVLLGADGVYIDEPNNASEEEQSAIPDSIFDALFPSVEGESHVFILRDRDSGEEKQVTLTAGAIAQKSVPIVRNISTDNGSVAYVHFNRHNAVAETELFDAFNDLQSQGVTDLVLDLRYNAGGYISIASELAYMIAGPDYTSGQTFVSLSYNNDIGSINPFTGREIEPIPFYQLNSQGDTLPTLNLDRVFVLTSNATCSASELIMNGLAGVDLEVIQLGETTCGKPYAYYSMENCGTTYFTIMAKNNNAKGFGDYYNGFSADDYFDSEDDVFQGCTVGDDFSHDLGDENELMLLAALQFRDTGRCPQVDGIVSQAKPDSRAVKLRSMMTQKSAVPFSILSKNRAL